MIVGPLDPPAQAVVERECLALGADVRPSEDASVERLDIAWEGATYRVVLDGQPIELLLPLLGGYQDRNLSLVVRAVEALRERGFDLPDDAVIEGLRAVEWPGRFEVIHRNPTVILEGAHNVDGAAELSKDISERVPERRRRHLLFGVLSDKDAGGMLDVLGPAFGSLALCRSTSPRALPAEDLREQAAARGLTASWYHSVEEALEGLIPGLETGDVLVVAGSLTVVAEARVWGMEGHWSR